MFRKKQKLIFFAIIVAINFAMVGCFRDASTADQSSLANNSSKGILSRGNFKLNSIEDLQTLLTFEENRYPLISAHRGGPSQGYPENAIETFQHVANKLPVIIECDVRLSKDSVLVLMHDEKLNRTTSGKGKVSDYTLEELKELHLFDPEGKETKYRIPTLEEALLWGKGKVIFTLDVKKEVPYKMVSDIIEKTKSKPYAIVITYNASQARALYNVNPDLMISASIQNERDLRQHTQIGIPDNKLIAFVGLSEPDEELVSLLHQHGIQIILGSIGNLDKRAQSRGYQAYADYIANGADVISTDYPLEAKKALDYYIKKRNISSPYIN